MSILKNWESETNILADIFVERYFESPSDVYWVGEEVGGCLLVNDYFFNLDRILDALKYKASEKQLFDYYDKEIEFSLKNKKMKYNFKNYIKLKND